MDLLSILPFPNEIICIIFSYDRVSCIKKIAKTDYRYTMLLINPFPIQYDFYRCYGFDVFFTNQNHILMKYISETLIYYKYFNRVDTTRSAVHILI